ncbi:MAG: molybdopterin-synthase adenylyltransferase MoeB [Thermoplasmata archaeon]|nr:molybdopterin-synthase adenylyltransferase MoeB [Thermoplasmata archaeon]
MSAKVPPILVALPPNLRELLEEPPDTIEGTGATVDEVLRALSEEFPVLSPHLFSPAGTIRTSLIVLLNDDDVRYRQRGRTPVKPGDRLVLVPALAGGSPTRRRRARPSSQSLSTEERHRYSRHLLLPEVGETGQRRIRDAKVLIVGVGGLGAPAALYLAAAGVGTIGLVDGDRVDTSNLQRQVLYTTREVGARKTGAAARRLRALNPNIQVVVHPGRLTSENALRVIRGYDIVLDGTDNFPTRYLVNDACALLHKPYVYGSVYRFEGQVSVFDAQRGPCYRCLFPEPPPPELVPSCAEGGVLGVVPGLIGIWQATEALQLVLGTGEPLIGRILLIDALSAGVREVRVRKDPRCPLCGRHPTQKGLIDYPAFCGAPTEGERVPTVGASALATELRRRVRPKLIDVREPGEWQIAHLPNAKLIPRATLERRLVEVPRDRPVVVYCKSGRRSADAVRLLASHGFANVRSLAGGLDAWAETVDPKMPRY